MNHNELKERIAADYPDLEGMGIWAFQMIRDAARIQQGLASDLINQKMDAFFREHPDIGLEESELIEHAVYGWDVEDPLGYDEVPF